MSCGNGTPPSRSPQGPAVVALPNSSRPVEPLPPPVLDRLVAGSPVSFRLRASELANLLYQIDCLALTSSCSRAAYEDLWAKDPTLGGLDEADRAALLRWKVPKSRLP